MGNSPHTASTSVHILDDYSLLNIFYLYRLFLLSEDDLFLPEGDCGWAGERWWHKLAHVCRRWRNLILGSASYLRLCLYCTKGTPIADMLAHSPPLPLVIEYDYYEDSDIAAEDEECLILALEQRNRILRIRLRIMMDTSNLQKFIMAIDEEFPILEYLSIVSPNQRTALMLPETLHAPRLHQLSLIGFIPPIRSRLLTTAVGLVTLFLSMTHPSTCFHPNDLLHCLSLTPQLEVLVIGLLFPFPHREVERQLTRTLITTPMTFPNLRRLLFDGVSAYLEALVHRITTPGLEELVIRFINQLMFSIPHVLQFIGRTENLSFGSVSFSFSTEGVHVMGYPREGSGKYDLLISVHCSALDWQVSSIAQISNALSQAFYMVEHLTLLHDAHGQSSEEHGEVDHTDWQKLLGSFSNVKTIRIDDGLVKGFCRCLQLDDGELPLDFLPELQELRYIGRSDTDDSFTPFINARQIAGRPVTLVRLSPSPSPSESPSEGPTITLARSDVENDSNT